MKNPLQLATFKYGGEPAVVGYLTDVKRSNARMFIGVKALGDGFSSLGAPLAEFLQDKDIQGQFDELLGGELRHLIRLDLRCVWVMPTEVIVSEPIEEAVRAAKLTQISRKF